jgi:hypothetical protein
MSVHSQTPVSHLIQSFLTFLPDDACLMEKMKRTTRATRISIFKPSPSDIIIFLVHAQVQVVDTLSEPNGCDDARYPTADNDHSHWAGLIDRSFFDGQILVRLEFGVSSI